MTRESFSRVGGLVVLSLILGACQTSSLPSPESLELVDHQLVGPPELEPLIFQPLQGSQEEVLADHAKERAMALPNQITTVDGRPTISSLGQRGDLVAELVTASPGPPEQTVRLFRDDEMIFETFAGLPSPVLPLQALWTYDGHWALEILFADESTWAGEIFIDADLLNAAKGYDEGFGFQLLSGKPFFFYVKNDHVGYSFDGQETDLAYDEIPHYRCCSESVLNPIQAQNMVAFFAVQDTTWYYVELGAFAE